MATNTPRFFLPAPFAEAVEGPSGRPPRSLPGLILVVMITCAVLLCALVVPTASLAQREPPSAGAESDADPTKRAVLRFLTDSDFPPFDYLDEDGALAGFNVDLAQAICLELAVTCEVRNRPWAELLAALDRRQADAVVAGHAITPALLDRYRVSKRYLQSAGRFAARRGKEFRAVTPEGLEGKRIAVARGSAHEAYVRSFFRESAVVSYESAELAREALVESRVDLVFDDSASLAFWIGGTLSKACCEAVGAPFLAPHFFGDGMAVVLAKDDLATAARVDVALDRIKLSGRFEELLAKHFPVRVN